MKSCFRAHSREWSIQRLLSVLCFCFFFPFPFAFFSCHQELNREYFLKLQLSQTVLADNFTEVERLAGYLFCLSGWMYLTVQVLWADAKVCGVGWWLFKYHGQGPFHTCPDHPWVHLSGVAYVGSSAQPWPFCRHHYVGLFATWCFWKSCFSCESMSKALGVPQCVPLPHFLLLRVSVCAHLLSRGSPSCLGLNCCPLRCSSFDFSRFQRQTMRTFIKLTFPVYHSMD